MEIPQVTDKVRIKSTINQIKEFHNQLGEIIRIKFNNGIPQYEIKLESFTSANAEGTYIFNFGDFNLISNKPPIGLKPRFIHNEQRLQDIKDAVKRFADANLFIPDEWMAEYYDLIFELQNKKDN